MNDTDLIPTAQERMELLRMQSGIQRPAPLQVFDPVADVERATVAAKALMQVVELTKPLKLNGKTYLYFEHWQTLAQFFHHSVGIEFSRPIMSDGEPVGWEAKALLYNADGIVVGGAEACCLNIEPNWRNKPVFQVRSMAQTRAMSKALRSRFGFVPVLVGLEATPAEEMDDRPPLPLIKKPVVPIAPRTPIGQKEEKKESVESKLEAIVLGLAKGEMEKAQGYMKEFSTITDENGNVHAGFNWFDDPRLISAKGRAKWIAATYGRAKEAVAALATQGEDQVIVDRFPGED